MKPLTASIGDMLAAKINARERPDYRPSSIGATSVGLAAKLAARRPPRCSRCGDTGFLRREDWDEFCACAKGTEERRDDERRVNKAISLMR